MSETMREELRNAVRLAIKSIIVLTILFATFGVSFNILQGNAERWHAEQYKLCKEEAIKMAKESGPEHEVEVHFAQPYRSAGKVRAILTADGNVVTKEFFYSEEMKLSNVGISILFAMISMLVCTIVGVLIDMLYIRYKKRK